MALPRMTVSADDELLLVGVVEIRGRLQVRFRIVALGVVAARLMVVGERMRCSHFT